MIQLICTLITGKVGKNPKVRLIQTKSHGTKCKKSDIRRLPTNRTAARTLQRFFKSLGSISKPP